MDRITDKRLENRVATLNKMLDRPATSWTRISGENKANIGNLHISHAYGGVSLHEMCNDGGGVNDLNGGHGTKRELDTFISGMMSVLYMQRTN